MKKTLSLIIITAIALVITVLCVTITKPNTIVSDGSFNLAEHTLYKENLPENCNLGIVPDQQTAALEANKLWREAFGREFRGKISVKYDSENDCWLVSGQLSLASIFDFPYFPNAIIKTDGTVLSIWLDQF